MGNAAEYRLQVAPGVSISFDLIGLPGRNVLVMAPGFWRTRHSRRIRALAQRLAELSPVAVVDLRGHGDSTGCYTFGRDEPADVRAVAVHLESCGFARLGLLGFSMGGTIGMDALRSPPVGIEVVGAALVSSPTHVRRARPWIVSRDVLRQVQPEEIIRWPRFGPHHILGGHAPAAARRPAEERFPVAIFHGRDDWLIPDSEATAWARALGPRASLTILEGTRRMHADALLADGLPLADLVASWWKTLLARE